MTQLSDNRSNSSENFITLSQIDKILKEGNSSLEHGSSAISRSIMPRDDRRMPRDEMLRDDRRMFRANSGDTISRIVRDDSGDNSINGILTKLVEQFGKRGKKLSQLIAESWLPGKEEYKEKFMSGDQNVLKQLLIENEIFDNQADADRFEEIKVEKDLKTPPYEGKLGMRIRLESEPIKLTLIIPYPDPDPVSQRKIEFEDLEKWIKNNKPHELLPSNNWIPHSTT